MKKILISIFLVVCILQITACGKTVAETSTEETAENETTENETTENETTDTIKENSENGLDNLIKIEDQSFAVDLNDWGTVDFISGYYEEGMTEDLSFYLVKDQNVVYSFPQETLARGLFDEILAVGFRDINNDNLKDVIIVYTYETGAGPQGIIPRPYVRIYTAEKDSFSLDENLANEIYTEFNEDDYTINNICSYASKYYFASEADNSDNSIRSEAYKEALMNLVENNIFPDGTEVYCDETLPMTDNKFAVLDIDQDGKDELLVNYTTSAMAGMMIGVFECDLSSKKMNVELIEFPSVSFYDNNIVAAQASHNHGKSNLEDFWPYSLYQYDAKSDQYQKIATVDAWQKEIEGVVDTEFPDDKDMDQDGLIFYLLDDSGDEPIEVYDNVDYEAWKDKYLNADEVQIDWYSLEESNILII